MSSQRVASNFGVIRGRFERVFSGVEKEIFEDEVEQDKDGKLAEYETLGESGLKREDVITGHDGGPREAE